MIEVAVLGAAGRMGAEVCRAVSEASDMSLAAAIDPAFSQGEPDLQTTVGTAVEDLEGTSASVVVDFTHPEAVEANIRWCLKNGLHVVVGTTGLERALVDELGREAEAAGLGLFVAPNFAVGAVLMMRFAAEASKHLPLAEIVELHHDRKADAPSGTALATAASMAAAREGHGFAAREKESTEAVSGARGAHVDGEIRIHSVRLPGFVAHQEVILSGPGETLTIRHDSIDRAGFMPGVLMAVRAVADRPGLTFGLDQLF